MRRERIEAVELLVLRKMKGRAVAGMMTFGAKSSQGPKVLVQRAAIPDVGPLPLRNSITKQLHRSLHHAALVFPLFCDTKRHCSCSASASFVAAAAAAAVYIASITPLPLENHPPPPAQWLLQSRNAPRSQKLHHHQERLPDQLPRPTRLRRSQSIPRGSYASSGRPSSSRSRPPHPMSRSSHLRRCTAGFRRPSTTTASWRRYSWWHGRRNPSSSGPEDRQHISSPFWPSTFPRSCATRRGGRRCSAHCMDQC